MTSTKRCSSSYSRETLSLIENLMNKVKLSSRQKKEIIHNLRKGNPLPITSAEPTRPITSKKGDIQLSSRRAKKRRKEAIIQSGAYIVDSYIPSENIVDREQEKQKLQDIFFGLSQIPENDIEGEIQNTRYKTEENFNLCDRMNELMDEIQERNEFLSEMEKLGLKQKYQFDISNEISYKLKQLEDLSKKVYNGTGNY